MAGAAVATSVILQKKKIKTELKFYNGDLSSFIGVAKCVLYCLQNWGIYMPVSGVYWQLTRH